MHKLNLSGKSYFLALFLLIFSLLLGPLPAKNLVLAQEQNAKIQYDLPFPGILPDSPFYKLKVIRDKLSMFFISDPLKRTDYYLLQADKGILATAMLIDKNKVKLAEETALKAENNITLLTFELKRVSEKPGNELFVKLETASKKHREVLGTLVDRVPSENKKIFITVINFSKTNSQTIEKLRNKRYYNQQ